MVANREAVQGITLYRHESIEEVNTQYNETPTPERNKNISNSYSFPLHQKTEEKGQIQKDSLHHPPNTLGDAAGEEILIENNLELIQI